ncbi:MAG: hypothetical protein BroJett025_06040 [Patescibacteria group bacterium]|nr:MAG: hypothetical protein BroJett025_06040 [Patescibacteria group bacterium]
MFNLFKNKQKGTVAEFAIDGMHCTSCTMNVDSELEELEGVFSSTTSYAKQKSVVEYDPNRIDTQKIKDTIEKLGYTVK